MNTLLRKIICSFTLLLLIAFSTGDQYRDGNYYGISRSIYVTEDYYGFTKISVEKGQITSVMFSIRDSMKHEFFNDKYEKYFEGNDIYIQQCRNDWKGVQAYPYSLLKYQNIDEVDAISGATWSYNLFKASAKEALLKALK